MQDNRQHVRDFVDEVLNRGCIEATGKYFWDDMVE
jgi:hypothetical protein